MPNKLYILQPLANLVYIFHVTSVYGTDSYKRSSTTSMGCASKNNTHKRGHRLVEHVPLRKRGLNHPQMGDLPVN